MDILLLGGAGFVGRYYAKYFLKQGYEVTCVDNIAPLTGGLDPSKWSLFNPYEYKKFKFLKFIRAFLMLNGFALFKFLILFS